MPVNIEAMQEINYEKSFVAFLDVLGLKKWYLAEQKKTRKNSIDILE